MQDIDDDNLLDIMPRVQDLVVDLILADLVIPTNYIILKNQVKWIAGTGSFNNGTAHKKGIMKLRKDESSAGTGGISVKAVKNRYLCEFLQQHWSRRGEGHYTGAISNPKYNSNVFSITYKCKVDGSSQAAMRTLRIQKAKIRSSLIQ